MQETFPQTAHPPLAEGRRAAPRGWCSAVRLRPCPNWLTTVRLPAYAPDLNPVEAVGSLVRRATSNTAFATHADLDRKLRSELRKIQIRPHLINGCLTAPAGTVKAGV